MVRKAPPPELPEVPAWVLRFDPQRWADPRDWPPAEVEALASATRWREILAHRRWSEAARRWWVESGRDPRELFRAQQAARRVALCEEHRPPAGNSNV